jgi:hypothetical protein
VIPFVIDMMNNVHSLPTDLLTALPTELPTEFILLVVLLVKMTCHHFFCFVLIFFPTVIPSVFLFVFINFLLVRVDYELGFMIYFDLLFMRLSKSYNSSYVFCELPEIESSCFIVF